MMRNRIAAVVLGMVALGVAGCGGGYEPAPARPIGQEAVTSTSGAGRTAAQVLSPGPLEPGSYTTQAYRPKLSFRVGKDWALFGDNQNGILLAQQLDPTSNPERIISVSTVRWVFDKPLLTDKELDQARERHIRPAPRDLLGWLRVNPYLKLGRPKPVPLGGARGVQFDLTVKEIPGPSNCQQYAPRHCVALYPITRGGGDPIDAVELSGTRSRYTLVHVRGLPVLVSVGAPPGQLRAFLPEADKVLKTVSFA